MSLLVKTLFTALFTISAATLGPEALVISMLLTPVALALMGDIFERRPIPDLPTIEVEEMVVEEITLAGEYIPAATAELEHIEPQLGPVDQRQLTHWL